MEALRLTFLLAPLEGPGEGLEARHRGVELGEGGRDGGEREGRGMVRAGG